MGDENNEGILEGKGVVKFFKDAQGYGFIFVADNEWRQTDDQVFVHQSKITMEGHRTLYENQHVYMKYQMEQKGYKATEVTPDEVWMEENKDYIEQQKRKQQSMQGGNFRGRDRGGYDDRYGGGGSYGSHGGYDDRYNSQYGGGRRYEQEYHGNRGGGYHGYGGGDYGHGHY